MKKLLFQFDTDRHASAFDAVVGYDAGADQVISHAGMRQADVAALVEGAIFTRPPKDKKSTAIFIGGGNMAAGEAILAAVKAKFFGGFRVSVMLDSNGGNTTAAAAVAKLAKSGAISGKKAVVLAGTGPVGQRAAAMLALEGAAQVVITSRVLAHAQQASEAMKERFGVDLIAAEAADAQARAWVLKDAQILLSTGAAGIELLPEDYWRDHPTLELIADANATPPLGVGGLALADRGVVRHGKTVWGALGFGPLKLALQRACVARLFEQNDLLLDAEEIFAAAKAMA
jgi:hypothetical protein